MAASEPVDGAASPAGSPRDDNTDPKRKKYRDRWAEIMQTPAARREDFENAFYRWERAESLSDLMNRQKQPPWSSGSYRAAYPNLGKFLQSKVLSGDRIRKAINAEKGVSVRVEDTDCRSDKTTRQVYSTAYDLLHWPDEVEELYKFLRKIPTDTSSGKTYEAGAKAKMRVSRTFQVCNISPSVLRCILGTSPKEDSRSIAPFVDRHLRGLNWGSVRLDRNNKFRYYSFKMEYHFSFFYVPLDPTTEWDRKTYDWRQLRRSAPLGIERSGPRRFIYEETSSFLLLGRFDDLLTCVQLSDSYFKYAEPLDISEIETRTFRSYDLEKHPVQFFMDWLAMSWTHVRFRWVAAIQAVDSAVTASDGIVFSQDRRSFMTDDAHFSLSKTYFWAMQTYKLFERTLKSTIDTWYSFENESLPIIKAAGADDRDIKIALRSIAFIISDLESQLDHVRSGIQDVKDLREGLQATATIFDSRTSVRQGANIRALTYITILFLPLTFGTAIFGMQIIENQTATIHAFAITISTLSIVTFLGIANIDTVAAFSIKLGTSITDNLLVRMAARRNDHWTIHARALQEDKDVKQPSVSTVIRKSSHWIYAIFVLECLFVTVPVREIKEAITLYGLVVVPENLKADDDHRADTLKGHDHMTKKARRRNESRAKQSILANMFKKSDAEPRVEKLIKVGDAIDRDPPNRVQLILWIIGNWIRFGFLPFWVFLLLWEFCILFICLWISNSLAKLRQLFVNRPLRSEIKAGAQSEDKKEAALSKTSRLLQLHTFQIPRYTFWPTQRPVIDDEAGEGHETHSNSLEKDEHRPQAAPIQTITPGQLVERGTHSEPDIRGPKRMQTARQLLSAAKVSNSRTTSRTMSTPVDGSKRISLLSTSSRQRHRSPIAEIRSEGDSDNTSARGAQPTSSPSRSRRGSFVRPMLHLSFWRGEGSEEAVPQNAISSSEESLTSVAPEEGLSNVAQVGDQRHGTTDDDPNYLTPNSRA